MSNVPGSTPRIIFEGFCKGQSIFTELYSEPMSPAIQ